MEYTRASRDWALALGVIIALHTSRASAQEDHEGVYAVQQVYTSGTAGPSPRERALGRIVMPEGSAPITAELAFLTADAVPATLAADEAGIAFTDAALLEVSGRYSFGGAELLAGFGLAPKSPSFVDAST